MRAGDRVAFLADSFRPCGHESAELLAKTPRAATLPPAGFRQELSFRFEPVGTRVTRQGQPMSPLGNKVGAHPNLFFSRPARYSRGLTLRAA
jgi:hypothetical protein